MSSMSIPSKAPNRLLAFILDKKVILGLYLIAAVVSATKQYLHGTYNNYKIFKHVFWHSIDHLNLYTENPLLYLDSNHYGPFFALLIAPFALLPDAFGTVLWNVCNALVLYWGIYNLPIKQKQQSWVAIICLHEALTALLSFQFNVALTGLILLAFSFIYKQQEVKAAAMIIIGFLVKLYGIVGLAFFFFAKNKTKFVIAGLILLPVLTFLPAVLSDLNFVWSSHIDWKESLIYKNSLNASLVSMQDISVMGMVRRISGDASIPNTPFLLGGLALFALPYLRVSQYKSTDFQLMMLSSVLIFTVIFSSGSESPTYIIAMLGVAIWFIIQPDPKKWWVIALFVFAMLLTSFSPSDLFPRHIRRTYIMPYSLKALPCVLVWLTIVYQMLTVDFRKSIPAHD